MILVSGPISSVNPRSYIHLTKLNQTKTKFIGLEKFTSLYEHLFIAPFCMINGVIHGPVFTSSYYLTLGEILFKRWKTHTELSGSTFNFTAFINPSACIANSVYWMTININYSITWWRLKCDDYIQAFFGSQYA